jgi:Na+/H+-translocating membrane pyrophosphatase
MAAAIIIAALIGAVPGLIGLYIATKNTRKTTELAKNTNHIQTQNLEMGQKLAWLEGQMAGLLEGEKIGRAAEQKSEAERQAGAAEARAEDPA